MRRRGRRYRRSWLVCRRWRLSTVQECRQPRRRRWK
jgi:hypothetical protein